MNARASWNLVQAEVLHEGLHGHVLWIDVDLEALDLRLHGVRTPDLRLAKRLLRDLHQVEERGS